MKRTIFALLFAALVFPGGGPLLFAAAESIEGILAGVRHRFRLAATVAERARGLMEVRRLPEREGMLFLYPSEDRRQFWMKDVYIPLDILFLDDSLAILEIVANAPPEWVRQKTGSAHDDTFIQSGPAPFVAISKSNRVRYVLEINGGHADRLGLRVGDRVFLSGGRIPLPTPDPAQAPF